jgi:hypothetical protein
MQPGNIKKYYTHDNGGYAFKVIVNSDNDNVAVYKRYIDDVTCFGDKVATFSPIKVFVGDSPKNYMNLHSEPDSEGNSILLHIKNDTYVYIGRNMYSFESYDKIISFESLVGNNDIQYPHAYDNSGNAYLFAYNTVVKSNDKLNEIRREEEEFAKYVGQFKNYKALIDKKPIVSRDANDYYVNNYLLAANKSCANWEKIYADYDFKFDRFYIGKTLYTMSFSIDPESDYDTYLLNTLEMDESDSDAVESDRDEVGISGISIVYKQGVKIMLNKEDYCKIMNEFAESKGYLQLKNKVIIHGGFL